MGKEVSVGKRIEKSIFWAEDVGVGRRNLNSSNFRPPSCRSQTAAINQSHPRTPPTFTRLSSHSVLRGPLPSESLPSALRRLASTWFVAFYKETLWLFVKKWCLMLLNHKKKAKEQCQHASSLLFLSVFSVGVNKNPSEDLNDVNTYLRRRCIIISVGL